MSKFNILLKDNFFAKDLAEQIKQQIKEVEIKFEEPDYRTELLFVDEKVKTLSQISSRYKELPIVLFSDTKEADENVDLVIHKPFKLIDFLRALKDKTLLPKVRRKECIIFNEYTLYPVKKEIYATSTDKTTKLTEREVDIIKYLYQISPDIATKENFLENVWEYSADATTHTVETHIYRLRQKVEKNSTTQLIITENNGYRLNI